MTISLTAEIREDCPSREQEWREWERDVLTHPDVQAGFASARVSLDAWKASL